MKTIWRYALAATLLMTLFATLAVGQSIVTGDLTGTVTDPSGAVVPNATVDLKNDSTGESQTTQTNGQGQYRFSLLKPGSYTMNVKASGLQTSETHVNVSLGQVTNVPVKVGVAGSSTTVEVTEQTPLIETENANIATTYTTSQLASLPTPGGDVTSYAYTSPGVTLNSAAGYGNFSAFGLPSTANLFTTNGNDNMDPYLNLNNSGASNLSLGANELQEIAVVNNGYTAQYGRQAGAQVNASTKSGTNQFHGNALYWWNGRALNANDWFTKQGAILSGTKGETRPFANNNQYAVSIGGPIVRNKLFFFVDHEQLRFALPGVTTPVYIPTTDFANYVLGNVGSAQQAFYQNIFNLYNNAPGSGRATPVTLNDDPSGNYGCGDFSGTAGFGTAATPCARTFRSSAGNLTTEWLLSTRVDWNISSNDRLFGRYKQDHGIQATGTDPINPIFNANSIQPAYEGQLNETHIFNGTTVNQLIISGSWYQALFSANNLPGALKAFPTTMAFGDGAPYTQLGGGDNAYPQGRIVTQYQVTDDFSKTIGAHDLKVGINFRRNLVSDYTTGVNTSGTLTLNSMTEFATGQFQGLGSTYNQNFSNIGTARIKLYSMGIYLQDQWKATSKLSLTMAIRADRNANPECAQHCFSRLSAPFSQISHDPTIPYNQVIKTGLNNAFAGIEPFVFSPRLGAAYQLTPSTVVRGGFGMFTDLFPATIIDRFITNAPNVSVFSDNGNGGPISPDAPGNVFSQAAQANTAFQQGFAGGATLAQLQDTVPGFSPPAYQVMGSKLYNPKFLEWNFELQQELGSKYSISANYVGNHGMDVMTVSPWLNAYCSPTGVRRGNCPFGSISNHTAPDPRFAQVNQIFNGGYSNYDGITTSFRYRVGSSFQGQFNYTWSHGLDTCSNNCLLPFSASTLVSLRYLVDPTIPGRNYGNSDYDTRHLVNMNYVYNTKSNWSNGFVRQALGNWTVAGTLYFHSGYGWSPVSTGARGNLRNVTGLRNGTPLAYFVGGPIEQGNCSSPSVPCMTADEFLTGAHQNNFGNLARNTLRGPGFFDTDLNVTKNFKVTERVGFAVGANFFNLFNHPNFDLPNNNVSAGNFGTITATVSPATSPYGAFLSVPLTGRLVQLNARLTF